MPAPRGRTWGGNVFIAASVDGFIARADGDMDWLTAYSAEAGETGYDDLMSRTDHVLIGRRTYETVLTFDSWPYEGKGVLVLSTTLPASGEPGGDERISVVRSIPEAVAHLNAVGAAQVYIDGGQVVQASLAAGLVEYLVITRIPILLGEGIALFGPLPADIELYTISSGQIGDGLIRESYAIVR
ncbi:MAG: dihydrofolate reductase [Ramlibacter sp.]|nr:dihydrofolate reductase [Cryobacterium sp.]